MGLLETLRSERRVIAVAPLHFLGALAVASVAVSASAWVVAEKLYSERIEILETRLAGAETENSNLRTALGGSALAKVLTPIEPTSPAYITSMSNNNLKAAAFIFAAEMADFVRPFMEGEEGIRSNASLSAADRAKQLIALSQKLDDEFRANFALNLVNLYEELEQRTGSEESRYLKSINDSLVSQGLVLVLASDLEALAKRLP
jgi:hypothetical protein